VIRGSGIKTEEMNHSLGLKIWQTLSHRNLTSNDLVLKKGSVRDETSMV
jgi:hypothetical protein